MENKNDKDAILNMVKLVLRALKDNSSIKSVVLGNALFLSKQQKIEYPVDLLRDKYYLKNSAQDNKLLALELERSKFPSYDALQSLSKFLASNWIVKSSSAPVYKRQSKPVSNKPNSGSGPRVGAQTVKSTTQRKSNAVAPEVSIKIKKKIQTST